MVDGYLTLHRRSKLGQIFPTFVGRSSSDSGVTLGARDHLLERRIQIASLNHSDPPPMAPQGVFLWHQHTGIKLKHRHHRREINETLPTKAVNHTLSRDLKGHFICPQRDWTKVVITSPAGTSETSWPWTIKLESSLPKTRRFPEAALRVQSFSKNNRYKVTPGLRRAPSALSKSSDHDHHRCTASPTDSQVMTLHQLIGDLVESVPARRPAAHLAQTLAG